MTEQFELPVDIQRKSEVVQERMGLIITGGVIAVITFLLFLLSVNVGMILAKGASALPDVSHLETWRPNESTRIFDRDGNLVANIHGDEDRVVVPISEISPFLQRAVLATEDNRFYHHNGIDTRGTVRAAVQNLKGGRIQGGSTITQQLVKNLFLTPERTLKRKIAEAALAFRVERHYNKTRILELYLNQVYWGNQSYGIEKAARRYFRKPAKDLDIAESALLAGLLKAPEGLSPYNYPEQAKDRQMEVLEKMERYGYITQNQRLNAAREELALNTRGVKSSKYPFFVTFVIQELERELGSDVVRQGGLRVYTTLDKEVQESAEEILKQKVASFPKYSNVNEGAFVAMDVDKAEVIAMVGGVDFERNQFNNVTQARRAVGSTFKPFVYLTAFRLGLFSPESMISDKPVSYPSGAGRWAPKNWDGKFMGPMTIRKALTLSRNTTTVQVGMKVGIGEVTRTAKLAGITSNIDQNSSSLLGSSGVSPYELLTAYTTFARGGVYMKPTVFRRLENSRGEELEVPRPARERVLEPTPVYNLVSILVDVVEKGTGRSARLPNRQVAGKTGTTDKNRDVWFSGFTPDLAAIVWMGNEKYVPLKGAFSFHAAEVWGNFAKKYYELHPTPATTFPAANKILVKKSVIINTGGGNSSDDLPEVPLPGVPLPSAGQGELLQGGPPLPNPLSGNGSSSGGLTPLSTSGNTQPAFPKLEPLKPLQVEPPAQKPVVNQPAPIPQAPPIPPTP